MLSVAAHQQPRPIFKGSSQPEAPSATASYKELEFFNHRSQLHCPHYLWPLGTPTQQWPLSSVVEEAVFKDVSSISRTRKWAQVLELTCVNTSAQEQAKHHLSTLGIRTKVSLQGVNATDRFTQTFFLWWHWLMMIYGLRSIKWTLIHYSPKTSKTH